MDPLTDQEKADLAKKALEEKAPAKKPAPQIDRGDIVHLVHSRKGHIQAKVTKVHSANKLHPDGKSKNLIDLEGVDDPDLVIAQSPRDDSGVRPDSWHPIEPSAAAE